MTRAEGNLHLRVASQLLASHGYGLPSMMLGSIARRGYRPPPKRAMDMPERPQNNWAIFCTYVEAPTTVLTGRPQEGLSYPDDNHHIVPDGLLSLTMFGYYLMSIDMLREKGRYSLCPFSEQ